MLTNKWACHNVLLSGLCIIKYNKLCRSIKKYHKNLFSTSLSSIYNVIHIVIEQMKALTSLVENNIYGVVAQAFIYLLSVYAKITLNCLFIYRN